MLFLIPAYLSEESPIDYFAPSIKEYILKWKFFLWKTKKQPEKVIKFLYQRKNKVI